jgi:[ribosomal protein S5]-alanine N-acetyltransferase
MKNVLKPKTVLETERLILRFLLETDTDNLQLLFGDPEAMRYFPSVKNHDETREWIQTNIRNYAQHGFGLYACMRKKDDRLIGYCGFIPQDDVNGRNEIEIGYGLIRSYWGLGYATEAAKACKIYGFETLKFHRLISLIRPENTASIKIALRNGMKREPDILRWNYLHTVYSVEKK